MEAINSIIDAFKKDNATLVERLQKLNIRISVDDINAILVEKGIMEEQEIVVKQLVFKDETYGKGTAKKLYDKNKITTVIHEILNSKQQELRNLMNEY